jgi:HemK-related putative methylase
VAHHSMTTSVEKIRDLLGASPYGRAGRVIGKALYWRYRERERRRRETVVLEHIEGVPLLVTPGVLNPRSMRSGAFFASRLVHAPLTADSKVLDMGTGSGVCALVTARHSNHVTAVDIDDNAVRCAQLNVLLNGMDGRVRVLQGNLFAPLTGRRFDLILFNPPYVRAAPRNDADRAWRSTDVAERFACALRGHLNPAGCALVLLSTFGDPGSFIREFQHHGFDMEVVAERNFINEKLLIIKLS